MLAEMKSVKMMGLSKLMTSIIQGQRVRETRLMAGYRWCIVWINVVANFPEALVPAFTFAVYAIQATVRGSSSIGTTQAFTSLAIIQLLMNPAAILLIAVPSTISTLGCFDRIQNFLVAPPRRDPRHIGSSGPRQSSESTNSQSLESEDIGTAELKALPQKQRLDKRTDSMAIYVGEADIRPAPKADIILRDITFSIAKDSLTMVIGSVASGKSTLLRALLGELPLEKGAVSVSSPRIAYCSQTPWLPNATIREVICGPSGTDGNFDKKWYQSTIHACALDHDLNLLPDGDQTGMGSGSTVLSGGQKHRVALARAVYARAEIILLDDVLNALDSRTKKTVVDRLLGKTGLLRRPGSTVVLVTHDGKCQLDVFECHEDTDLALVAYLSYADKVLVLGNGRLEHEGTYEQIMRQGLIDRIHLSAQEHQDDDAAPEDAEIKNKSTLASKVNEADDLTRATGDLSVYRYYFSHFSWWKGSLFFLGVTVNAFGFAFSRMSSWHA